MIDYLIFGISYALVCVVQPGPFQVFLFSQSLTNGWRKTIPLVFAPLISDLPIIILVLFVLKKVTPDGLLLLQCIGGLFLLYLAYNAYRSWCRFDQNMNKNISSQVNVFKAVMINLLNPNPYMVWSLVMGPLLIKGWNANHSYAIVLLAGFYSSMITYSIGMVILFAAARNLGQRVNRISVGISVICLALFGLYKLWSGIKDFL
jgi:threonine/homoserine/homoserine lactone efflux protein